MNKKILLLILLLINSFYQIQAQEGNRLVIKGVVTDANTGEAIPLTNIIVLGTMKGVASDMNGEFELIVPESYNDHVLRFSVMGYARYELKVREALDKGELNVAMQPISIRINQVEVKAKSRVLIRMLRDVVNNIDRNYITKPYNYTGYFQYKYSKDGQDGFGKEAIVEIFDKTGYKRSDVETAFKDMGYIFTEVRREHKPASVYESLTYFDDILTADIVRNTRNVLDFAHIDAYTLSDQGKIMYEGDSIQMIGYEVEKPTLSTTGNAHITKYSGVIYVNMSNYAVIKNEIIIQATDFNYLGRNLITTGENKKEDVRIVITTTYKKSDRYHLLNGINISYSYNEGENKVSETLQYVTTAVNYNTPKTINGRMYYEEVRTNSNFWNAYTVRFED